MRRILKEQFSASDRIYLPKIDHQDQDAVILGYGVYKRAMEDSFIWSILKKNYTKLRVQM